MNSASIKTAFPDWETLSPGEWSEHGHMLYYGPGHCVEIGLYREPMDDDNEYAGTYTLQIFDGDEVIFCAKVE